MLSTSTLLSLSGAVTTVLIGGTSTFFSRRAAKLSAPTGNGWTEGLGKRLDSLDSSLTGIAATQGRIEDRVQLIDERLTAVERPRAVRPIRAVPEGFRMTVLTAADVLELALGAGMARAHADVMTVIAHFESGWNPNNNGDLTLSKYGSVGLWQIFTGAHTPSEFGLGTSGWNKPLVAELFVPATNAHAARVVLDEQGYAAWSTYNSFSNTAEWAAMLKIVQAIQAVGGTKPAPVVAKPTQGYLASKGNTAKVAASALEYAKSEMAHPLLSWKDLCASFVRNAYGIPITAWGSVKRTAAEAWALPADKDKHSWYTAPQGCPVFWTGGAGHVAIADGKGNVYTTDFLATGYVGDGKIHLIPQGDIAKHDKSLKCAGWSETFLGVRVYN